MTLALFLQISPNNSVECCNLITPPGCQHHHWAGSEVEAQTWWGLAGPRPDSMPRPRSLRGIAVSSRRYCSCPCHRGASPGQWPEGHWRSQTSAASHQYEPRNSAGVQCEVFKKGNKNRGYGVVADSTWRYCCPLLGWRMASPQIMTLSWSDGQKVSSWSRSPDKTPEQKTQSVNHRQAVFTITVNNNMQQREFPDLYATPAAPHWCPSSRTDVPDFAVNPQPNCPHYKNRTCLLEDLGKRGEMTLGPLDSITEQYLTGT